MSVTNSLTCDHFTCTHRQLPSLDLIKNKRNICLRQCPRLKCHGSIPPWSIAYISCGNVIVRFVRILWLNEWMTTLFWKPDLPACLCVRETSSGILLKTERVCCVFAKQKSFPSPSLICSLACYPSALLYKAPCWEPHLISQCLNSF